MQEQYDGLIKCPLGELDDSYRAIFMPQGLGDILFFLMYVTEYKRLIPEKKIAVVVVKKHFMQLAELFSGRIDALCFLDMEEEPFWRNRMTYFYNGIYNSAPQPYLLRAVQNAMGIPETARAYLPPLPRPADMDEKEVELGLQKGKAVLIAPDAVSCDVNISDKTWIRLAEQCKEIGFQVYFNVENRTRFAPYPTLFLSMIETMNFIADAGGFISFRSGLCDVMAAFTDVHSFIIYPNNKRPGVYPAILGYDIDPNGAYLRYCSLKNIFPLKDITELVYCEDNLVETIFKEVSTWQKC